MCVDVAGAALAATMSCSSPSPTLQVSGGYALLSAFLLSFGSVSCGRRRFEFWNFS